MDLDNYHKLIIIQEALNNGKFEGRRPFFVQTIPFVILYIPPEPKIPSKNILFFLDESN